MYGGNTVRLNFEFPREDYPYLKMMCAAKGVSFRELATELLQNAIEEYANLDLAKKARERLDKLNPFPLNCSAIQDEGISMQAEFDQQPNEKIDRSRFRKDE